PVVFTETFWSGAVPPVIMLNASACGFTNVSGVPGGLMFNVTGSATCMAPSGVVTVMVPVYCPINIPLMLTPTGIVPGVVVAVGAPTSSQFRALFVEFCATPTENGIGAPLLVTDTDCDGGRLSPAS